MAYFDPSDEQEYDQLEFETNSFFWPTVILSAVLFAAWYGVERYVTPPIANFPVPILEVDMQRAQEVPKSESQIIPREGWKCVRDVVCFGKGVYATNLNINLDTRTVSGRGGK